MIRVSNNNNFFDAEKKTVWKESSFLTIQFYENYSEITFFIAFNNSEYSVKA